MLYYEKKFGASGKNIALNDKQTKNALMLLFTIMGSIFAIMVVILYINTNHKSSLLFVLSVLIILIVFH